MTTPRSYMMELNKLLLEALQINLQREVALHPPKALTLR